MKKRILTPGFEVIFSVALIAILALPPMLVAQTNQPVGKDYNITIVNGDTTINGKKPDQLSPADRMAALKDINNIESADSLALKKGMRMQLRMRRMVTNDSMHTDSMVTKFRFKKRPLQYVNHMNFKNNMPDMRMPHRNSENFDYVSTDADGISTHVRFHVTDASDIDLKRMEHVEGPRFDIKDLSIVPEFSAGKTVLMFGLPAKTPAQVKLSDSQGKLLWSEKITGGNFTKAFPLTMNGIYFLQVKQGNAYSVKRVMKEE